MLGCWVDDSKLTVPKSIYLRLIADVNVIFFFFFNRIATIPKILIISNEFEHTEI